MKAEVVPPAAQAVEAKNENKAYAGWSDN
jgi:hypothetical protein